jgi:exodeoxyribonuclease-3
MFCYIFLLFPLIASSIPALLSLSPIAPVWALAQPCCRAFVEHFPGMESMNHVYIISWNINGLRSIVSKGLMNSVKELDPDRICLQKIKVSLNQIPKIVLPECLKIVHSVVHLGYSGRAIFAKCAVDIEATPGRYQARIILLEYEQFSIAKVYTPNSGTSLARLQLCSQIWGVKSLELVRDFARMKPTIVCRDCNAVHEEIDLTNRSQNHFSAGFTNEER